MINAKKTKEMALSFSRTFTVCDILYINGSVIEEVNHFKYLGTTFIDSLKWHEILYVLIASYAQDSNAFFPT